MLCALFVVKDFSSLFGVLQRPDFVFMDDYLAEGLLRLCVHLVKVSVTQAAQTVCLPRKCEILGRKGFIAPHSAGVPVASLASQLLCIQ